MNNTIVRHHKVVIGLIISAVVVGIVVLCGDLSSKSVLTWKALGIWPAENYWVQDHIEQQCWRVEIEVTNITPSEAIVDWHRDQAAFQIAGRWENLGISALMPYLGPNESRTFPLYTPRQAQACRLLMYYEHGPFWSRIDQFLQSHNTILPLNLLTLLMNFEQKMPGHYQQLVIKVKLPAIDKANLPLGQLLQLERLKKNCSHAERGFWGFGEALAKAQVCKPCN